MPGPPTRFREQRAGRLIRGVVLHDPGVSQPRADVLARAMAMAPAPGSSYGRILGLDGAGALIEVQAVEDKDVAWHAGGRTKPAFTVATGWDGYEVNENTLGLCATLAVDEATYAVWVTSLLARYGLGADRVWAHREVAFSRTDPRQIADMDAFRTTVARLLG